MAPPEVQADTRLLGDLVGLPPVGAGDLQGAREYVARIEHRLASEDVNTIERRKLYKQRAKWRLRAEGKDARWMVVGLRGGSIPQKDDSPIYTGEDDDEMVRVIEQKFSRANLRRLMRGA